MTFSAANFRTAVRIAEDFELNRDLFIVVHLEQLDPVDKDVANYIMNVESPYAPCEADHDCSTCGFSPICIVKEKPRNVNIMREIEDKHIPDFGNLGKTLAEMISGENTKGG